METERFGKFTLLIDGIHKNVSKIKTYTAPELGVKSVHVFWLYTLSRHPEGLTSAELASQSDVDRSLVSREIVALRKGGYIVSLGGDGGRSYNSRHKLTERGFELADRIIEKVLTVQKEVGVGISEEELNAFYSTLEKLHGNFAALACIKEKKNGQI